MGLLSPSALGIKDKPETEDEVPRDKRGRPRIYVPEKKKLMSYTRVTTYIDCLDDKTNLNRWDKRNVLIGSARAPSVAAQALSLNPEDDRDKEKLNKLAEELVGVAGGHDKADKGTHLHDLSEFVDRGEALPRCSAKDLADMAAYKAATIHLDVKHIEKLTVHDELKAAGTPDRVSFYDGFTPSGKLAGNLITDLKTGSIEYGAKKMAMQLALYSRSLLYDWKTQTRSPLPDVNQDWGLIIHLPAGSAQCELHWVDLNMGWESVLLARQVRADRNKKKVLRPFS